MVPSMSLLFYLDLFIILEFECDPLQVKSRVLKLFHFFSLMPI